MFRTTVCTILLTLFSVVCIAQVPKKDGGPTKPDSTPSRKVKFTYPGSGVGPDPTTHVSIYQGKEAEVASRCILDTLAEYGYSLNYPLDKPVFPLKPVTPYSTSTGPLRTDLKKILTDADPVHPLPKDLEILSSLDVSFEQGKKFWVFRMVFTLYTKDRTTPAEKYGGQYDAHVVPDRILGAIDARLAREHPKAK